MYAIAIDVGVKNLGICIFDFTSAKVVLWDNVNMTDGRYMPTKNVDYVRALVARYSQYFENATALIVERQMRCNMRIIEAVLQTMYYPICIVVDPRAVKLHYALSMKNYRLNKAKAVEWAVDFLARNPQAFEPAALNIFETHKKRDDLADSLLMVLYYLDTYSNQLNVSSSDVGL
tara:strand:+ start:889 stop:1413 length:525 start_codon:yes stop_codon:yes gene_type:complete